jgi:protein SCO1/2
MQHRNTSAASALLVALALLAPFAWSHEGHGHAEHGASAPAPGGKPVKLSDTVLLDQDGRRLRLASDALGDKVVVVSFVFTHCTDTCPMVSHTFAQVQEKLGALMEQRVRLISLTVDPARDTPQRLKAYSSQFGAGPGWLWLTGNQPAVTTALQAFGLRVANPENHPVQVLVGDPRSGRWTRLYDIDNPQQLVTRVTELLAQRPEPCPRQPQAAAVGAGKPGCVAQPG